MSLDDGYVTPEYLRNIAEHVRALKELSYGHMEITPGATLLDAGCGPGVDTPGLAALTGPGGRVIGIDNNPEMLAEAERTASGTQYRGSIEHRQGSVMDLPLDDESVDACRAERLLQVLPPDAEGTVASELVRVTRPGGRIVLVDTDWSSACVDFSDIRLERRLMEFFTIHMRPNGLAGRRLYSLCREQGLEDICVEVVPVVQHRVDDTPFGDWLPTTAATESAVTADEARQWQEELQWREAHERFYACVNMVIASGRKPDRPD